MKITIKILGVLALYVVGSLSGCKDDDPKSEDCNGTFAVTINSESFVATSFNNTLLKGSGARRMDIRATDVNGKQLIITFNDLTSAASGNGVSTDAYIPFADITTGTENVFFFTIIENSVSISFYDGELDITSSNGDAKRISGTFSFSNSNYEVTNGSFTDQCYTVIQ